MTSLIMFCYQLSIALNNLIDNKAVDSTEYISIADLDSSPVITFCPRQGENHQKLEELDFDDLDNVFLGNIVYIFLFI